MSDQFPLDVTVVDRRVMNALKRLQSNPELKVTELAEREGLSRSRLEYLLKQDLRIDIRSCKRSLREKAILQAARRILETSDPLKQIQHDFGFRHRGYFTRWFRNVIGATPAVWRRHGSNVVLDQLLAKYMSASVGPPGLQS